MNKYYESLNDEVKEYFSILSEEFPEWLLEYIDTPEMERISKISMSCGTDYSKCFNVRYWYSNLDHSVGVALIIWNFTHDKKQTLAGLFHDIATPVFKHCIDFMNGDSENQESTEERTSDIIKNSKRIMSLLKRDGIKLEEVSDYKIYPIADNDTPKLSADRFEYTFSSGLTFFRVWELDRIRKIYNNIIVDKNETGVIELTFKDKSVCEEYIDTISKLWPEWVSDKDRTVMQFLADICKSMSNAGFLNVEELYTLSEQEVINKILNCEDKYLSTCFKLFQKTDTVYKSLVPINEKYCVNVKSKTRYVVPLVKTNLGTFRINKISDKANKKIDKFLNLPKGGYYTYFDFPFEPYETSLSKRLVKKYN
ncbi:MAG: HD domain-containing protein [bacterium]|nr:HD domain-containing protein [bacterium]